MPKWDYIPNFDVFGIKRMHHLWITLGKRCSQQTNINYMEKKRN